MPILLHTGWTHADYMATPVPVMEHLVKTLQQQARDHDARVGPTQARRMGR